jgi:hypothetical protein
MIESRFGIPQQSSSGISEETVIQRILAGETSLYSILAARCGRRICYFARRMLKNG